MPWKVSGPVEQRNRFIEAYHTGLYSMTDLCAAFEVSRKTGYKWRERFSAEGLAGLEDRSSAPLHSPQRMDAAIEQLLLDAREARPRWGPRKILGWLAPRHPELADSLPAASTVGDLYRRKGLVKKRKRRGPRPFEIAGALHTAAPNEVWTADFKGEFRLHNGRYCYPFTLADAHTRYLLACGAEPSTWLRGARSGFLEAFRTYGLPQAIRTDNGTPFVGHGVSGLSTLSVWWIKLGIHPQRIPKGRPDQNGRHERMHRTLAAETTRPPEGSLEKQQTRFDLFRRDFNEERPHEALDQRTPASCYQASARDYPERIAPPEYPGYYEPRKVDGNGRFKFRGLSLFLAHPMAGQWLGLVEIEDDLWSVRFYNHELGRINPRKGNFFIKVLPMSPV
jgi:putative transposase